MGQGDSKQSNRKEEYLSAKTSRRPNHREQHFLSLNISVEFEEGMVKVK